MRFPHAFDVQNEDGKFPMVFLCEHARNTIPADLYGLGVSKEDLQTHIAWDIGIENVTRRLSDLLDVPSVYCLYSRLIIDCNRSRQHPDLVRVKSDGIHIPGNDDLTDKEYQLRVQGIFDPYHNAAARLIEEVCKRVEKPVVLGMHSCTPKLHEGEWRPWEIGLSTYDNEEFMGRFAALLRDEGFNVGIHEPYDMRKLAGASLYGHAHERGLPHVLIEIRQDLIGDDAGAQKWAQLLADMLPKLVKLP